MDKIVSIFSPKIVFEIFVPMCFELCRHPVFSVRKKAAKNICHLLNAFENSLDHQKAIIDKILDFGKSKQFSERQMYVVMVGKIMMMHHKSELFFKYFYDEFDPLINDKISAVRISIAQTLQKLFQKKSNLKKNILLIFSKVQIIERAEIQQEIEKLKNDSSYTVCAIIHSILSK